VGPRPLRVAVVGSGPAGFYATGQLLAADPPVEVDLFDRLPTPWGLVRLGVAPDHPNIKAVSRVFERIAQRPGFRFLGNVEIGRDLTHAELARLYDAVVYTVGAQTDRRIGIPGEDLPGSWPATAFVAWYNAHPDFHGLPFDLDTRRAVVVGNGNVAVDVARMLALTPAELAPTDTADEASEAIGASGIEEIVVLGRRGPAQAAFTTPELQELTELAGADLIVEENELRLDAAGEAALADDSATARRNVELLRAVAATATSGKPKTLRLRFCVSPVAILGDGKVEAVEVVRNELVVDEQGRVVAVPTGEREVIECGLVLRSVGYRGVPIPGVPFDERSGTTPNRDGRVLAADGGVVPGLYCAGWIKRGPSGVIGTNKKDATETVQLVLDDAAAGRLSREDDSDVEAILVQRGVAFVTHPGWEAIDAHERSLGEPLGRPRVKLARWDELLDVARR
jgi:ferredoxin/flavodoxin---NADP+ reductase